MPTAAMIEKKASARKKRLPEAIAAQTVTSGLHQQEPVKEKTDREKLEEYLAMPDVVNNLRTWGKSFEERFRGNWFTLEQVLKKTPCKDFSSASHVLNMLILKGWAHRCTHGGLLKYKITFDVTEKIKHLRMQIEAIDIQKEALLTEIAKLEGASANLG